MRLIDADKLKDNCFIYDGDTTIGRREYVMFHEIDDAPTIDAVKVIRCKNCRHWNSETKGCKRNPSVEKWREDDFCKYGKRWSNAID